MPLYEPKFSNNSFGYRPAKSIQHAIARCLDFLNSGLVWAVDLDIEKFFDSVNRHTLLAILSRDIHDTRVLSLISKFINAPVLKNNQLVHSASGIPQGGPLSPLLANILLNELDSELSRRKELFVRYADDMLIFCRNEASAFQAAKHLRPFLEQALSLRINNAKTLITHAASISFLGYGFTETTDGWIGYNINTQY